MPSDAARSSEPVAIHDEAAANLRYIRTTLESTAAFTSVSGTGTTAVGCIGLAAAALSAWTPLGVHWLTVWLLAAVPSLCVGGSLMVRKALASGHSFSHGVARRFYLSLVPGLAAGVVLTLALVVRGHETLIPGTWMLLYGASVLSAGALSVRVVPLMGLAFMSLGGLALWAPAEWSNALLGLGFGGVHLVFGLWITRRYGG